MKKRYSFLHLRSPKKLHYFARSFNHHYKLVFSVLIPALFVVQGCATTNTGQHEQEGATLGAITGAILGHQLDHDHGALFGAAIGAIAGSGIGRYQDEQQMALEEALAQERNRRDVEIDRLEKETLRVGLRSDACFDFDSSEIKGTFYRALEKLGTQLQVYDKTVLHIVGHTDDVGSQDYNYALSIRRAKAVAQYLVLTGISQNRLRIYGRGELDSRSDNLTAEGRRLNRRVEIYIKPIVQGREKEALKDPYRAWHN